MEHAKRIIIKFDSKPDLDSSSPKNVCKHPNTIEIAFPHRVEIKPGATARVECPFELELGEEICGEIHLKRRMDDYRLTIAADLIHNGFKGRPTVSLTNNGDKLLELNANEPLAQIMFSYNPIFRLIVNFPK